MLCYTVGMCKPLTMCRCLDRWGLFLNTLCVCALHSLSSLQDGTSCEVAPSPEPVCDSTALGEAAAGSQQQQVQQQQQPASLPWHCDSSRVLVRHWSDGSSFNKEAAAVAAASASAAAAVDAEAAVAREASAGSQVLGTHAEEGHGQLGVDETAAAEQQPDAPDKSTQSTPAGPGGCGRGVGDCLVTVSCLVGSASLLRHNGLRW